jgi:uncharacterized protein YndB with AHSA1/START domain
MSAPKSQPCRGSSREFRPNVRLVLTHIIDFLSGVAHYDSTVAVDFLPATDGRARMVVALSQMHDAATTAMQKEGFTSQFSKLDRRYESTARSGGEAGD